MPVPDLCLRSTYTTPEASTWSESCQETGICTRNQKLMKSNHVTHDTSIHNPRRWLLLLLLLL